MVMKSLKCTKLAMAIQCIKHIALCVQHTRPEGEGGVGREDGDGVVQVLHLKTNLEDIFEELRHIRGDNAVPETVARMYAAKLAMDSLLPSKEAMLLKQVEHLVLQL